MRRLLSVLLVLLVLTAVADRVGALLAGRVVAGQLQSAAGLPERPDVDVRGVPFLTQALAGRYQRVEVRATGVPAGELTVTELTATLTSARVPLADVLSGAVEEVPVEVIEAQVLLAYDVLSRRSGDRQLTVSPAGDRVRVQGSVRVLGQTLAATAVSTVTVEGGALVVSAQEFEVGNEAADAALTRALRGRLDLRIPVSDLPYGLRLQSIAVQSDGVALSALARDVVLKAAPA
ncbi:MAG: LmeA family phospholipid-binding protein [Mycobacteriales bacterium]